MSDPIKILVTGDFCPHGRVEKLALGGKPEEAFGDFLNEFTGNDLNVVNLECPLTDAGNGRHKTGPHQKAMPETVKLLAEAGIGLVTMANNHMMDYGQAGVSQTTRLLKDHNMSYIGAGEDPGRAGKYHVLNVDNKQVAVLNFAENEFLSAPGSRWQCNPLDPVRNYADITKARRENDFVVVIIHGGHEFYHLPSPRMKELYRHYADIGADAIVSHHTHAYSGYEIYRGKPIFYGLGNFLYDWPGKRDDNWNYGYAVRLKLGQQVGFEMIPYEQCNERPGVFRLHETGEKGFYSNIDELNGIIADDEKLEAEFLKYCERVRPMYEAFIEPHFGNTVASLRKRGLFPRLMGKQKRRLLLNITRCESHREVLLRMLKKYE
jgi:poly-gamma-glutamate synthesis protein (capsule biosynthesis protein)